MDRNSWLSQDLPRHLPGLEIGPLDRPIMTRPASRVLYADHLDRAGLVEKYSAHENVVGANIPEIDFVTATQELVEAVPPGSLQYVIASHVIEHVPNPIKWLSDFRFLLSDGGIIALAIPDLRRCFDALRSCSIAGDWIEAFLCNHTRPSPARLFDALASEVNQHGAISWNESPDLLNLRHSRSASHALAITRTNHESNEYFDVHCWTFTPDSFCNLMRVVTSTGLIGLKLESMTGTQNNEFLVRLQRDDSMTALDCAATFPAGGGRFSALPPGFDGVRYLRLNPDVGAAGVDPYEHYLEYGRLEGRHF